MSSDDLPAGIGARVNINYEHSNKKKHLIMEVRSDDFKICTPKKIPHKPHFWSGEQIWLIHYKKKGEPDIRKLK